MKIFLIYFKLYCTYLILFIHFNFILSYILFNLYCTCLIRLFFIPCKKNNKQVDDTWRMHLYLDTGFYGFYILLNVIISFLKDFENFENFSLIISMRPSKIIWIQFKTGTNIDL